MGIPSSKFGVRTLLTPSQGTDRFNSGVAWEARQLMKQWHFRATLIGTLVVSVLLVIVGCGGGSSGSGSSTTLDGTYQGPLGQPMSFDFKGDKVTVTMATERKVLSYKIEGDKVTIINPGEGDIIMMRNADGSLNSEIGVFNKKKS